MRASAAFIGLLGVVGWIGAAVAAEEDRSTWPRWRGAASNGTAQTRNVFRERFDLKIRWKHELGSGYSGVVVADGYAVTLFSDGIDDFVGALDADTGEEAWRAAIAPTFAGREGAVDGPCSTPAIDDGVVYALGPRGDLLAVDVEQGATLWRRDLVDQLGAPTPHWGFTSSPLVVGDYVVVISGGSDRRVATAFDKRKGEEVWSAGRDEAGVSYQSAALLTLDGVRQIVVASDTQVLGIDPATGDELWSRAHGGDRFYARIVNPVAVRGGALFFNHRPTEGTLLRPSVEKPVWTTPHLNRNYATPLYHEGSILGYAGQVLTAVDARDGSLKWQSREPGGGWPILVDGHLVVLTKEGTLHVAQVTDDEYDERASIKMLDRLVWTPPSFAYGRIYGRDSFGVAAAVDIVAGAGSRVASETPEPQADTRFARWVAALAESRDRAARVDRFLAENPGSPLLEGELAHIFYVGDDEDLAIRADMLLVREERGMRRIDLGDGRSFFHTSFELKPDARVNYQLVRNYTEPTTDPRNSATTHSLEIYGEASEIFMPRAQAIPESSLPEGARIESFELESDPVQVGGKQWGGKREIRVYLPPGYDESDRRYPSVYVHYGHSFAERTDIENRLGDRIVVLMQSTSPYEYARSQRGVHARMVATRLVPEIDRRYRTLTSPDQRTVAGADEGAYSAFEIGLRYTHLFGNVVSQSLLTIGKGDRQLIDAIEMLPEHPLRIYLEWGTYDPVDPRNGTDVPAFNRRLKRVLEENGYDVTAREWNDGLDLDVLAFRLSQILRDWAP